jgi:peptidoglycan/xylan/chitin deacetylase (PgdA/CDA1 family)
MGSKKDRSAEYLDRAREAIVGRVNKQLPIRSRRLHAGVRETQNYELEFHGGDYNFFRVFASLIGVSVVAAAGTAAYQAMAPWAQGFGHTLVSGLPGLKQIALTYDDGPNDPHTLRLLDVLARHDVQATFFLIGRYVRQRPDIVRDLVKAGHVLGNHTFTHPNLILTGAAETRTQLEECQRAVQETTGEAPKLFRPPFGARRPATLQVARNLGLEPVMWNVTSWDWKALPAEKIVQKCVRQMRGGDVILMHDGSHIAMGADRSQTVIASERLIAQHKREGFEFVTVTELGINRPSPVASQL